MGGGSGIIRMADGGTESATRVSSFSSVGSPKKSSQTADRREDASTHAAAHTDTLQPHKPQTTLTSSHRYRIACWRAAGVARKLGVGGCELLPSWLTRKNPARARTNKLSRHRLAPRPGLLAARKVYASTDWDMHTWLAASCVGRASSFVPRETCENDYPRQHNGVFLKLLRSAPRPRAETAGGPKHNFSA